MTEIGPKPENDPPAGFAALFGEAYGRLWVLAAALIGDRVEAEDLVQDAALVGMQKFGEFEHGTSFVAWMSRIVRFHASNWRSKQTRRRTHATDPVDMDRAAERVDADPGEAPSTAETASELGPLRDAFDDRVVEALEAIAPRPRACLLLKVVHDMSYEEIGRMLEIPPGTAMSHVHRTRTTLRKRLSEAEV